ncbi:hypothetical protein ACFE04_007784 [Oxalis oulophora]
MSTSYLSDEDVHLCADLPEEIVDSILLINIITSCREFCRLRCVSRRIKELTDDNYASVDLSDHPVAGPGNFRYSTTYFIERCLLNGNEEALFNNGIIQLCSWKTVAGLCSLEYASNKKHMSATYIFWLLKMLDGRSDSWSKLAVAFSNREEIDYCRYVVWSCISYFTVLVNFPNFSFVRLSSICTHLPESVYPMYPGTTGFEEVEYHPHNRRTCCHKCFWMNELILYVINRK